MKYVVIIIALVVGCARSEHRDARVKYNEGVAALAKGDLDAATKLLLEARSAAGVDPELRFRAAYDLGLAYAERAAKIRRDPKGDLAKALEYAQQAMSWLADANRLRPTDAATKKNLGIVRARLQAIADELRKGEGKLENRIEAAIKDQRGVLDGVREAWLAIKKAGGTDPLAQQGTLTHLADVERGVVAEVGAISDIAADEIDTIGKKEEDKRTDEEKVRVVQLKNIEIYLQEARGRIADARRKLQELAAEDALGRAEAALVALKRAREQLLDPITVLKTVAQDELEVVRDTAAAGGDAKSALDPTARKPEETPAWLAPDVLAERQGGLRDRLEEVRARLAAGAEAPPDPKADPQHQKLLERVKAALPAVVTASTEMENAKGALANAQLTKALEHERLVLVALAKAIEEFSDLKQTIELAYADQNQIVALLSAEGAKLPAAERAKETKDALARNLDRMARLQGLIADQLAQVEQQKPPPDEKDPQKLEAAQQQQEQAKQQMARAETLRGEALAALGKLDKALAAAGTDPVPSAAEAKTKIEELRKLFFSVIEHLQQLIRDQGETRDQTSAANSLDEFARADKLPGLVAREDGHGQMAKAITDALAAQADEMGKNPQAAQQGGPDAKAFTAAADEVRLAQGAISDATAGITKARDAKQTSESLAPAVKAQGTAIEHLENALKHLQPPPQQNQDEQKQDQQQQQQQQQQQAQQQSPAGAGQAARDQDAQQQKKRRDKEGASDSSVEKDW
jgi:Ca-activated chloride channel homolog